MVFNAETDSDPPGRPAVRHDWSPEDVLALYRLPFNDLLYRAQTVHRAHFDANEVQVSTLLSIKTGGCPEDCADCPQSAHFTTSVKSEKLMAKEDVLAEARKARAAGASRFCMGAAWRAPNDRDLDPLTEIMAGVKSLGLETCATLGMLTASQAKRLKDAGLDYYNHNLDTSEAYYDRIITTRTYQDRLDTLAHVSRGGDQRLLRRDPGDRRASGRSRRVAQDAGQPARAPRERADQHARPRGRHPAAG